MRVKDFFVVYCVPVSVTSQVKVVRVPVFDAAVSVRVAGVEAPAARTVFCRFHVNAVSYTHLTLPTNREV